MSLPALKFMGFESLEWQPRRLDTILKKLSDPVKVETDKYYREIGIRSHGKGIFHKEPIKGSDLGKKRVFWVKPDALALNIVFAWEQAFGVTTEEEKGFIASHRFPMYLPKDNLCSTKFLKYFFLTKKGNSHQIKSKIAGKTGRTESMFLTA